MFEWFDLRIWKFIKQNLKDYMFFVVVNWSFGSGNFEVRGLKIGPQNSSAGNKNLLFSNYVHDVK